MTLLFNIEGVNSVQRNQFFIPTNKIGQQITESKTVGSFHPLEMSLLLLHRFDL